MLYRFLAALDRQNGVINTLTYVIWGLMLVFDYRHTFVFLVVAAAIALVLLIARVCVVCKTDAGPGLLRAVVKRSALSIVTFLLLTAICILYHTSPHA